MTFNSSGPYSITVTATDDETGENDVDSFELDIAAVPAPTIVSSNSPTNNEGDSVTSVQPVVASAPNGDGLSFAQSGLPSFLSMDSSGVVNGQIPYNSANSYPVSLTITDTVTGYTNTASFVWYVAAVPAPSIVSTTSPTNNEGDSVTSVQPVVASAPNGDGLTFSSSGLPSFLSMDSSGVVNGQIPYNSANSYPVSLTITDTVTGYTNTASFVWYINAVPAPSIVSTTSPTNNEGDSVTSVQPVLASAPNGDGLSFAQSGLPSFLTMDSSGVVNGQIPFNSANSYPVSLTITDTVTGYTNTASFVWYINAVPAPSIVSTTNPTNNEGDTVTSVQPVVASAPNGDGLSFAESGLPSFLGMDSSGNVSGQIPYNSANSYPVTVTVTDTVTGYTNSASIVWLIGAVPGPSIVATTSPTNNEGDSVTSVQPVVASAPNGDGLSFAQSGLPSFLTMDTSGVVNGQIPYSSAGSFPTSLTITDTVTGYTNTASFVWYIAAVPAPSIVSTTNPTNNEGDSVTSVQPVIASAPNNDTLSFNQTGLPSFLSMDSSGVVNGQIPYSSAGSYPASLTITDTVTGYTNTASLVWYIAAVPAPSIVSTTNPTNNEGDSVTSVQPVVASAPNNDTLSFNQTGLPSFLSMDSSGVVNGQIPYSSAGSYPVSLTITDTVTGYTNTASFVWYIAAVPAPSIVSTTSPTNNEGDSVTSVQPVLASAPNGDGLSFAQSGLPSFLTMDSSGVVNGQIPFNSANSYPVSLTITDTVTGYTNTASFVWYINAVSAPSIVTVNNQSSNEGQTITGAQPVTASGPNGDPLSFVASGLPATLGMSSSGSVTGQLRYDSAGSYPVNVTITDTVTSYTTTTSFTWVVDPTPILGPIAGQSWVLGSTVSLLPPISNPYGASLSITASGLASGLSIIDSSTGQITGSPDTAGTGSATIYADTGTGIKSRTFPWTVTGVPVLSTPDGQSTMLDVPLVFSSANDNAITVSDTGGSSVVLTLAMQVANGTLTLGSPSGITIVSGADVSAAMTISGTAAAIDSALNGLSYCAPTAKKTTRSI